MNETPLVTVVVPVYKVEKYLKHCVNTIINQTYKNLEIILVDDGSPDKCGSICESFSELDKRVKVIHKSNGGLSDARNYGILNSSGEYITFVDSDDALSTDYIEYLYNLCASENADISCCSYFRSNEIEAVFPSEYDENIEVLNNIEACESLMGNNYNILVTACWKLYRTEIVKKHLFPKGHTHEDEATTFKYLYSSNKVVIGRKPCYMYYQNPNSITNSEQNEANNDTIWALNHRIESFIKYKEYKLAKLSAYKLLSYLCSFYDCTSKISKDHMKWFERTYIFSPYTSLKHKIRFVQVYRFSKLFGNPFRKIK